MLQTLPSRRASTAGSAPPVTGGYKVDISRGERIGRVSSEWFTRRNLNVQPTLTVRAGFPVRVIVNKDIVLRPYSGAGTVRAEGVRP